MAVLAVSGDLARQLGYAICAQWGIDPSTCCRIEIVWVPDELPYAVADLLLNEGVVRELLRLDVTSRERV